MARSRYVPHDIRHGAQPAGNTPRPEWEPNFSLDGQITQARALMGEQRWAALQGEWA